LEEISFSECGEKLNSLEAFGLGETIESQKEVKSNRKYSNNKAWKKRSFDSFVYKISKYPQLCSPSNDDSNT